METLFRFSIRKTLIVGPSAPASRGLGGAPGAHGSPPAPVVTATGDDSIGDSAVSSDVGLGSGVELGTDVGGMGVDVGIAACVLATIVAASASAVA